MEPNLPTPNSVSSPPKQCAFQNCVNKVIGISYCPKHQRKEEGTKFRNKRQQGTHPWYNKNIWRGNPNKPLKERGGLRATQLLKQPLCECDKCKQRTVPKTATVADHIIEWKTGATEAERWKLFSDPDNLQSMAEGCHNRKTARNN